VGTPAAGLLTVGCASVPVRPTQQECPPGVFQAMKQRDWTLIGILLKPDARAKDYVTLRPGPIISITKGDFDDPKDALLYGHVYFAEDGRTVVRYTEIRLDSGERVPICAALGLGDGTVDLERVRDRTEERVVAWNRQVMRPFRVLPD